MLSEKTLKEIESLKLDAYDLRYKEMRSFLQLNETNSATAIYDAFRYGFLKGQRAAKAQAEREAVRS